jgi:Lipase (class 3)
MINDLTPAVLCDIIYKNPNYFDKIFSNEFVYVGYKLLNNEHTITCRGSDDFQDWEDDAKSIETSTHAILGKVGKGFIVGIDDIYPQIKTALPNKTSLKIYGHSLGGAHALYLAGLFVKDGYTVEIVILESPRASNEDLNAILAPYPVRCYRNGSDFVTQVPTSLEYPRDIIQLNCPPVSGDISPFRFHHAPLLVTAFADAILTGSY